MWAQLAFDKTLCAVCTWSKWHSYNTYLDTVTTLLRCVGYIKIKSINKNWCIEKHKMKSSNVLSCTSTAMPLLLFCTSATTCMQLQGRPTPIKLWEHSLQGLVKNYLYCSRFLARKRKARTCKPLAHHLKVNFLVFQERCISGRSLTANWRRHSQLSLAKRNGESKAPHQIKTTVDGLSSVNHLLARFVQSTLLLNLGLHCMPIKTVS